MAKSKKAKNIIFEDTEPTFTPDEHTESNPSTVENVISVGLGLAVVLVIGAMIVNVIRGRNTPPSSPTAVADEKSATISATYTVESGDTLWSIAEKHYNDGYKWTEIQKANSLTESDTIEKGMELMIPKIESTLAPTAVPAPSEIPQEIDAKTSDGPTGPSGTSPTGPTGVSASGTTGPSVVQLGQTSSATTDKQYTVVFGDTLWDIAMKKYGNGYRWTEIAQMNNLSNPDLIFSETVLLIP